MSSLVNKFSGKWQNENGQILVIKGNESELLVDYYRNNQLLFAQRNLLGEKCSPAVDMKAYFREIRLIVELGSEGLGPTLELDYVRTEDKETLIPSVLCGLYDDWEDDFGVPWIFPLSLYKKID